MTEPHGNGLRRRILGEAWGGQCRFDHRREVAVGANVAHAGPCHEPTGENAVGVSFFRTLDAVGRHEDCTGKRIELGTLVLPRAAVIAY